MNTSSPATARLLAGSDVALAVGADVFSSFLYVSEPFLAAGTKLIHLDNSAKELEKIYPTEVGILSDPAAGMAELADALDQDMSASLREAAATRAATWAERRRRSDEEYQTRLRDRWDRSPMPVERMMRELAQAMPENTIVADEAITSRGALLRESSLSTSRGVSTASAAARWAGVCPALWGSSWPIPTARCWR